jgi:ribosomal protein S18 acetylase RimI-like enzyme
MQIRPAKRKDLGSIIGLMYRFAEYENLLDHFEATEESLAAAMFGSNAFVNGLVAESDDRVVGYALFYPNFATFRGQRGMYLEDIYILAEYQGNGIGEKMLRQLARFAKENGCQRIDFQVLEWNELAISFYEKLGAVRDDTERHFKFTDSAFERLADE